MTKIVGSGSESISQRHGSADPVPDPDPHCLKYIFPRAGSGWTEQPHAEWGDERGQRAVRRGHAHTGTP
jgi:hypothetical protein